MKKFSVALLSLLLCAFSLTATAKEKEKKYDVELSKTLVANGVQLKPGSYQVILEGDSLHFFRNGSEVAAVPVHPEELQSKNTQTSLITTKDRLDEVRLDGTNVKLMVGGQ